MAGLYSNCSRTGNVMNGMQFYTRRLLCKLYDFVFAAKQTQYLLSSLLLR